MEKDSRCAILYLSAEPGVHVQELRHLGFRVQHSADWPADAETIEPFQGLVLRVRHHREAAAMAMRLRARRRFGQRVLIALLNPEVPPATARQVKAAGFDAVLASDTGTRNLAAAVLRGLRRRPEHRCGRRPAA